MTSALTFDDGLPALVQLLLSGTKLDPKKDGYLLRDGFGRVAFVTGTPMPAAEIRRFNKAASDALGKLAFPSGALQVSDSDLPEGSYIWRTWDFNDDTRMTLKVVDRRLIGRDWLTKPADPIPGLPPMLTFGSIKGGVGRTTALFVLAIYLSRLGKNVLVVDLDLEAPGLASLLFADEGPPDYGALEYLVETSLNGVADEDLHRYVGRSLLTDRLAAKGRVDLLPATGMQTEYVPESMMAKLARALVERPSPTGPIPLSAQLREMISRFASNGEYDAILVDARAGLAELTAGPLLGLGSNLLMFGTDHPHTFDGYRFLLAHLGLLAPSKNEAEWRDRLHFIHAKAPARVDRLQLFDDRMYDLLAEFLYDEFVDEVSDVFNFGVDDDSGPHRSWKIYHDAQFLDVDYLTDPAVVDSPIFEAVFSDFIAKALDLLAIEDPIKGLK